MVTYRTDFYNGPGSRQAQSLEIWRSQPSQGEGVSGKGMRASGDVDRWVHGEVIPYVSTLIGCWQCAGCWLPHFPVPGPAGSTPSFRCGRTRGPMAPSPTSGETVPLLPGGRPSWRWFARCSHPQYRRSGPCRRRWQRPSSSAVFQEAGSGQPAPVNPASDAKLRRDNIRAQSRTIARHLQPLEHLCHPAAGTQAPFRLSGGGRPKIKGVELRPAKQRALQFPARNAGRARRTRW